MHHICCNLYIVFSCVINTFTPTSVLRFYDNCLESRLQIGTLSLCPTFIHNFKQLSKWLFILLSSHNVWYTKVLFYRYRNHANINNILVFKHHCTFATCVVISKVVVYKIIIIQRSTLHNVYNLSSSTVNLT